jgi:hypothetical protein
MVDQVEDQGLEFQLHKQVASRLAVQLRERIKQFEQVLLAVVELARTDCA